MGNKLIENDVLRPQVIAKLTGFDYHVEITHGSLYQTGFPDLLVLHKLRGVFWIELKKDINQKLRPSQIKKFAMWSKFAAKIYVVWDVSQVPAIFDQQPNWHHYYLRNHK